MIRMEKKQRSRAGMKLESSELVGRHNKVNSINHKGPEVLVYLN